MGDRSVPPHDRGAIGRHRHDRRRAGGRGQAMDEGRRNGGGVHPAGRQPRDAGDAGAHGGCLPERAHRGIHAVDAGALRGDAGDRERAARAADQAGPGPEVRREGDRRLQGVTATMTRTLFIDSTPDIDRVWRKVHGPKDIPIAVNMGPVAASDVPKTIAGYDTVINDATYFNEATLGSCAGLKHIVVLGTGAARFVDRDSAARLGLKVSPTTPYPPTPLPNPPPGRL